MANHDQCGFYTELIAFHKRWEQLMSCWKKFAQLQFENVKHEFEHSDWKEEIGRLILYGEQINAFTKMVEAVKWYNGLKK